jgi:hypothetical protein
MPGNFLHEPDDDAGCTFCEALLLGACFPRSNFEYSPQNRNSPKKKVDEFDDRRKRGLALWIILPLATAQARNMAVEGRNSHATTPVEREGAVKRCWLLQPERFCRVSVRDPFLDKRKD